MSTRKKEDRKELECEHLSFKTNTVVSSVGKRNGVQYEKGSIIFIVSCWREQAS
jgi:hypothetical protein